MKNLELLATYQSEFEAELVRTKLEDHGIIAMVEAQALSNVFPSLDYSNGVHIYVEPEDLERAQEIVNDSEDELSDDMDTEE